MNLISNIQRLRLRAKPLPNVEAAEHHAWREGWWQGIPVGFVIGAGMAVVFLHR